jgi:DNA-binding transcriptional ArsR family regulator
MGSDGGDDDSDPALEEIPLSLDAMLEILANRRRRHLIEHLHEAPDNNVSFEQAVRHVVERVSVQDGEQPNRNEVEVSLQHKHLPRLADAGVLEYDLRSQTIRYRPDERLEELLERIQAFDDQ